MITVDQYEYIRTAHRVYGKGIRAIARDTGHSKNTVKKALSEQYGGYAPRKEQTYPVLGPYLYVIDSWLKGDKEVPKKQRHTARRIYHRLVREHGYTGGESTIRRYVRESRVRLGVVMPEVFIPCDPQLGQEAEVDWGTCYAVLGEEYTKLKMFCMRSKGSGKSFVQCFPCERQQVFFEGHIRAFDFYGGVFPVLIYDNLTTAVEKVLKGKDRKLQESFKKFHAYYSFAPRFCNPGQGHEKGGVEGLVGYARRNFMVPVPHAENLEGLNRYLLEQCVSHGGHRMQGRDKTVNELFEAETGHLIALAHTAYSNIESCDGKVDKYSTVIVDKNRYSVPTRYAGGRAHVLMEVDRIVIFQHGKKIASHVRLYGNNKWQLDPLHYLDLIYRRPQAFDSARPLAQWKQRWPDSFNRLLDRFRHSHGPSGGTKEFITVLQLFHDHAPDQVIAAVEQAVTAGVSSSEAVVHLVGASRRQPRPLAKSLPNWQSLPSPNLAMYDMVGGAR